MNRYSFVLLWLCGSALAVVMGVSQVIANPSIDVGTEELEFKLAQLDDRSEDENVEIENPGPESEGRELETLEDTEGLGAEIDNTETTEDPEALDEAADDIEETNDVAGEEPLTSPSSIEAEEGTTEAATEGAILPELRDGFLRVGNRTPYPLRVVVLVRDVTNNPTNIPAHWDFAPGEGGSEGLALSLREREPLVVGPGDIIVAFSIDGSRRYWGPNVVDETLAPFWNSSDRSWTMILQP